MKYIKHTLIFIFLLVLTSSSFAQDKPAQDDEPVGLLDSNMCITTYTSEPCGVAGEKGMGYIGPSDQNARYQCTVCGANAFLTFIGDIYKYIYFICLVIGVLMVVILGIGMTWSGVNGEDMKEMAKKKLIDIFIGLLVMGLIPWILKTVAPFFFE